LVDAPVEILLITGPAGVGKSTLCWEMGAVLAEAGIAHVAIESDELDRVFPKPGAEELAPLAPGARESASSISRRSGAPIARSGTAA